MRVFIRNHRSAANSNNPHGPLSYKQLELSSQQLYSADEIESILTEQIDASSIHHIFVSFENENLALSCIEEIPLVSKMASLYHNALVKEAWKWHDRQADEIDSSSIYDSCVEDHAEHVDDAASDGSWDEETKGARIVYDATFEQNADLVPWRMLPESEAVERFGVDI